MNQALKPRTVVAYSVVIIVGTIVLVIGLLWLAKETQKANQQRAEQELQAEFDRRFAIALSTSKQECGGHPFVTVDPPEGLAAKSRQAVFGRELLADQYNYAVVLDGDEVQLRIGYNDSFLKSPGDVLASQYLPGSKFCKDWAARK
jgi:hypothetical protein